MNKQELKNIILTLATSKVKELNTTLKERGIKGYSKLKKLDKLEIIIDMLLEDMELETVQVEVDTVDSNIDSNNDLTFETATELNINFNVEEEFISKCKLNKSFSSGFGKMFGVPEKSNEEIVKKTIDEIEKSIKSKNNKLAEVKADIERCKEINRELEKVDTDLRVRWEVYFVGKDLKMSKYLVGSRMFREFSEEFGDMYYIKGTNITKLDEYFTQEDLDEIVEEKNFNEELTLYILEESGNVKKYDISKNGHIDVNKSVRELEAELINYYEAKQEIAESITISNADLSVYYCLDVDYYLEILNKKNGTFTESYYTYITEELLNEYEEKLIGYEFDFLNTKNNLKLLA